MGRIGRFFKKVWGGIKKGATKVWDVSKNVIQKVAKIARPVADVAQNIGGALSALPGKAGLIGTGLAAGGAAVKGITNMLPDGAAKDKINESIDKVVDTGQNAVNKVSEGIQRFNNVAQPWINSGVRIANKVALAPGFRPGRGLVNIPAEEGKRMWEHAQKYGVH